MPSTTTIRVTDALGAFLFETAQFLEIGDNPGLHYILSCGLVGALTVTLPPDFNALLPKDGRIHVMRSVNGGPAQREGESCFLIRKWVYGDNYTTITALHANHIMWRRCDLYTYAGYVRSTQPADDFIKEVWAQNFGSGYAGLRCQNTGGVAQETQVDLAAYVSAEANETDAPSASMMFNWLNTGEIIRNLCDASTLNGTYLTAEIVAPSESTLELRTYTGQRGTDRTFASGSGLLFTEARGNLANALLTVDATEEITLTYAGGADRDYGRSNEWAVDLTRIAESPFGRIEGFVDSGNVTTDGDVQADADAAVRAGRPVITTSAELQETDQCIRGIDFDYGDLVTVEVQGIQYDMRLDVIEVKWSGGVETTQVSFYANG